MSTNQISDAPKPEPCLLVVFGAHGDLTRRKLVPSLFNLQRHGLLPDRFAMLGNSRTQMSSEAFRQQLENECREFLHPSVRNDGHWHDFVSRWQYVSGDIGQHETFERLAREVAQLHRECGTNGNCLFYLATAPDFFAPVVEGLATVGLGRTEGGPWRRFIFEKPFGTDLDTARELNGKLLGLLNEDQIYRIDHYLGKETVQNIMVLRFANGIFEPIWNRGFIESVQITVAETLGVEERGGYYDHSGALRDMVPNHLFQLLSLIAMEPPISFTGDAVRDEKVKAIKSLRPLNREEILREVIRGQYGEGAIDGRQVPAYHSEPKVAADSHTETYVAMKLWVDNWRWAGVPFLLRTGKRLPRRLSEVRIRFKCAPMHLFRDTDCPCLERNQLVLTIQPEENVQLLFGTKVPGPGLHVEGAKMEFDYGRTFDRQPTTGYETLLYDAMSGDPTLFLRADQIESSWAHVSPILKVWEETPPTDFPNYAAGSWGPRQLN